MPDISPKRLLIVDDEASLMRALCTTLRDEGYHVAGFTSGEEALEALRPGEFDVVMADLMMPKMDGIAVVRQALAIDPHLAVIVMTGHGSVPTAVEAMKMGAIDYVLKPFKLSAMLPALERAVMVRRLRAENAVLEKRVRQRTLDLEVVNRDLEAFCDTVTHDLRTPLRTITGFSEILCEHHAKELPPSTRRLVDLIHTGACEMGQLITDLLAFSRLGRQSVTRKKIDLEQLAREVFENLKGEDGGRVEFKLQPLPGVSGDPALLRIALVNLLSNALKYTRTREHACVEVGVEGHADEEAPVFFVRDNGVGFDMKDAANLFGIFQRFHSASEFEGTGVGLATVRRIVERHGGRIWAEAAPDLGATFFFTLPEESAAP